MRKLKTTASGKQTTKQMLIFTKHLFQVHTIVCWESIKDGKEDYKKAVKFWSLHIIAVVKIGGCKNMKYEFQSNIVALS